MLVDKNTFQFAVNCYPYPLYLFDPFGKERKKTELMQALGSSFTWSRIRPRLGFQKNAFQYGLQTFFLPLHLVSDLYPRSCNPIA